MIFTIGHSVLNAADFVKMVKHAGIEQIWDTRSHPTSRWEQHRKENMERWLPECGIDYCWEPSLGGWTKRHLVLAPNMRAVGVDLTAYARGRFPKQRISKDRPVSTDRPSWTNQGLYDYSWYTGLLTFHDAAARLVREGIEQEHHVAIMCCECHWWRCHRSMISDYLWANGKVDSHHVMGKKLTRHSSILGNRLERYDPRIRENWAEKSLLRP